MTQSQLADKLFISSKTVSKWETEKGLPDIGILNELAIALGVSVTDLLLGEYQENEILQNRNSLHKDNLEIEKSFI